MTFFIKNHVISNGSGAKQAFLNLLEQEKAWQDNYDIESNFLHLKRYKIVSTNHFTSEADALGYIKQNLPFKMRAKTAGCVIINSQKEIKYLFFNQETTNKEKV